MKIEKICPFSLASSREQLEYCLKGLCAIYEKSTGTCGLLTQAYLLGLKMAKEETTKK
jgi:hypothetical protein